MCFTAAEDDRPKRQKSKSKPAKFQSVSSPLFSATGTPKTNAPTSTPIAKKGPPEVVPSTSPVEARSHVFNLAPDEAKHLFSSTKVQVSSTSVAVTEGGSFVSLRPSVSVAKYRASRAGSSDENEETTLITGMGIGLPMAKQVRSYRVCEHGNFAALCPACATFE